MPHKIILKVNISHFALIPIVLSFFTIFFFNIWKDKSKEEKSRSDFIQHLFFPMLRCKTWVCNVDISYLKITVLIEESHFFMSVPKNSTQARRQWHEIIINGPNIIRPSTVVQTQSIHKNFIRWTLVTRIILKPLN